MRSDHEVDLLNTYLAEQFRGVASSGIDECGLTSWCADYDGVGLAYINFWKNCLRRNSVVTQEAGPKRLHFCELVQRVVRSTVLVADLKVISRRTGYRARSARQSASDRQARGFFGTIRACARLAGRHTL